MSEPTNTQSKERTLTVGVNTPVMFRQGDGHHDGWELKLKAPTNPNRKAIIGPPDSSGWSLQMNNLHTHTAVIECPQPSGSGNSPPDYAMVIWRDNPDDKPKFQTRITGELPPCTWNAGSYENYSGTGGQTLSNPFQLDIIDGLVFLVEPESSTGVGSPVKIAAYKRQGESSSEEDRVPVYVDWSAVNASNLIFRKSIPNPDAGEGEDPMMAGHILDRENEEDMRQTEVWVESSEKGIFTVNADTVDEPDNDSSPSSYTLDAIVHVYDIALVVDANRDRKITTADRRLVTEEKPWRFWYNNDRDFVGETAVVEYNRPGEFIPDFNKYYIIPSGLLGDNDINPVIRDFTDLYPLLVDVKHHYERINEEEGSEGEMTHRYTIQLLKPDENHFGNELKSFAIFSPLKANSSGLYLSDLDTAQEIANILINDTYRERARLSGTNEIEFTQDMRPGIHTEGPYYLDSTVKGDFIEGMLDGSGGVLLMQHNGPIDTVTKAMIRLSVYDPDFEEPIITEDLHISLSSVEKMFAHVDLTNQTKQDPNYNNHDRYVGIETGMEPENYPDEFTNDTRFVFVHGYNNNMKASSGANAEIFKRLHLLGSNAKYVAVSWFGWQSQVLHYSTGGYKCPEYQLNVINAFNTAPALAFILNSTNLSIHKHNTVIMAHSLGNMLVSSAIEDHDLNADQYYALNSAVSQEAYVAVENDHYTVHDDMVHQEWAPFYNSVNPNPDPVEYEKLYAFNWHRLFKDEDPEAEDDSREKLTWDGRFKNVPSKTTMINLWSLGDKTFNPHPQHVDPRTDLLTILDVYYKGEYAFALQEKLKGRGGVFKTTGVLALGNERVGGWGLSEFWQEFYEEHPTLTPMDAHSIPISTLKVNPYFIKGTLRENKHPEWIRTTYENLYDNDIEIAASIEFRNTLLAVMVPSRLLGMGRANVDNIEEIGVAANIEMQSVFYNGGWPINDGAPQFWDHGHAHTIALPYTFRYYDFLVGNGRLR